MGAPWITEGIWLMTMTVRTRTLAWSVGGRPNAMPIVNLGLHQTKGRSNRVETYCTLLWVTENFVGIVDLNGR